MADTSLRLTIAAHFDGRHIVPDEPVSLPTGTPLKVVVSDAPQARNDERLESMLRFIGGGDYAFRPDPKYIDDRSTYYEG